MENGSLSESSSRTRCAHAASTSSPAAVPLVASLIVAPASGCRRDARGRSPASPGGATGRRPVVVMQNSGFGGRSTAIGSLQDT